MFDFPQPQLGPGVRLDAGPPVGQIFPQPKLDDGRRLDDVTKGCFAVLADAQGAMFNVIKWSGPTE
jgi:3-(3-hydroxy-phenyl)propionate hydroxylase